MGHYFSLIPCQDLAFHSPVLFFPLLPTPAQKRWSNCSNRFRGGCGRPSAGSEESMRRRKEWKRRRKERKRETVAKNHRRVRGKAMAFPASAA